MVRSTCSTLRGIPGEWLIPSIARSDPAFKDQNYWRGRIWGPMNFIVYLGLAELPVPGRAGRARAEIGGPVCEGVRERRHIHENYNAITGESDDTTRERPVLPLGRALLGVTELLEHGFSRRWVTRCFGSLFLTDIR